MLSGGLALEGTALASIGQAIATTGTGMTFWGLGIGAPKIMPNARDARIPKGKVDNYALNPNNPMVEPTKLGYSRLL